MKIGADPEFELQNSQGQFIDACQHLPTQRYAKVGCDGLCSTGELRPTAGKPRSVASSLAMAMNKLDKILPLNVDAIAGSGKNVALGGHIHFSGLGYHPPQALLQAFDKFITTPLNEISDHRNRSNRGYGQLSEWRQQPHGWEYRSPASWISHPWIAQGVIWVAWELARAYNEGKLDEMTDLDKLIEFGKTSETPSSPPWYIGRYKRAVENLKASGFKLEQVMVLQAWKKRSANTASAPIARKFQFEFPADDMGISEIKALYGEQGVGGDRFKVIGASSNRSRHDIIFLPEGLRFLLGSTQFAIWERNEIGISYSLRDTPDKSRAVELLRLLNTKYSEYMSRSLACSEQSQRAIDAIEGRRVR